jgi:glycosyltransferase involved in cell wall biosynthesis
MEGDVVAACVKNAQRQGCERVFLVDNDSPDDTVDRAVAAGAELARSFRTDHYDEELRMRLMNEVVEQESGAQDADHVWWLWLDADEFAHGPHGLELQDYLGQLDAKFRIAGTRYFNHYPSGSPQYTADRHPIDFQPLCEELAPPFCAQRHRKHPLQRWDRDAPPIVCGAGFHKAHSDAALIEPTQGAFLHHFPFRDEAMSRARLDVLCTVDGGRAREDDPATAHMLPRYRSLEAVYDQRWDEVENFMPGKGLGVSLTPWTDRVAPPDQTIARWYPNDD